MNFQLFTIGHSSHTLEHFLELLQTHGIEVLADIRRFPGSRSFPHFGQNVLGEALAVQGIEYRWMEALGGRRPAQDSGSPSPNGAWRNRSFQNYADYMLTKPFQNAAAELFELATQKQTAMMCSESVFWRCHRRLVSDYALASGGRVEHIFPDGSIRPHELTKDAVVESGTVTYPGSPTLFD